MVATSVAHADTGVSDERVSLPDGPGSMGGAGENLRAHNNMGALSYEVPLDVPARFPGATPSLALSYSSMSGNDVVGIGWRLHVPHIERLTVRGLPKYGTEDVFAADGREELVRVKSEPGQRVYRARFEGGFVRYTWHDHRAGRVGYWLAEYPDGSRGYFGAYAPGGGDGKGAVLVPKALARANATEGTGVFRYMLVKSEDRFGHAVRYHYKLDCELNPARDCQLGGGAPLLHRIEYLFAGSSPSETTNPRYVVTFRYETRSDVVAYAAPGFELLLTQRLAAVDVQSKATLIRRYALSYDEAFAGTSRLVGVTQYGLHGTSRHPLAFQFEYSSSLDLGCTACEKPFVFDMGRLQGSGGIDLASGRATLIDINGDSLPDLLDTTDGAHHFYLNRMDPDGSQAFAPPSRSRVNTDGFRLDQASVQSFDIDGDGLTDLINALTGDVLCNRGVGDWTLQDCPRTNLGTALFEDDDGDSDPKGIRFLDANGDRRIDIMQVAAGSTQLRLRTDKGYELAPAADPLEHGFDDGSSLQLADLNGDGLLDPAKVDAQQVWYRLHLGSGKFAAHRSVPLTWKHPSQAIEVESRLWELQDLNGDGLDDVVAVVGNRVYVALNRAGAFLAIEAIDSSHLDGAAALPERKAETTVLFADMNGSGTTDVVWLNPHDGNVKVLELFALRPNLLTRIDNGLGGIQTIEYGSSAREQARDEASGKSWRHRLPQSDQPGDRHRAIRQLDTGCAPASRARVSPRLLRRRRKALPRLRGDRRARPRR